MAKAGKLIVFNNIKQIIWHSLRVPLPRETENWTTPKSISLNHLLES